VVSQRYLTPDTALAEARSEPGLSRLLALTGGTPLPASIEVQARQLADVGALSGELANDPAVDPSFPTSCDADTYQSLQGFARVAALGALAVLLIVGMVVMVITAIRSGPR
jgi:cell division protein FtsX